MLVRPCLQLFGGASWALYASFHNQSAPILYVWQRTRRTDVKRTSLLPPVFHSETDNDVRDPSQVAENFISHFRQVSEELHLSQSFQILKQNT